MTPHTHLSTTTYDTIIHHRQPQSACKQALRSRRNVEVASSNLKGSRYIVDELPPIRLIRQRPS